MVRVGTLDTCVFFDSGYKERFNHIEFEQNNLNIYHKLFGTQQIDLYLTPHRPKFIFPTLLYPKIGKRELFIDHKYQHILSDLSTTVEKEQLCDFRLIEYR